MWENKLYIYIYIIYIYIYKEGTLSKNVRNGTIELRLKQPNPFFENKQKETILFIY